MVCYDRRMPAATASTPLLAMETGTDRMTLELRGEWRLDNAAAIASALAEFGQAGPGPRHVAVDFTGLSAIDLPGAWLLRQRLDELQALGSAVEMIAPVPEPFSFIDEITRETPAAPVRDGESLPLVARTIAVIGRESVEQLHDARDALGYFGHIVHTGGQAFSSLKRLRLPAIVRQVHETGIQAMPIVSLIAFLISVIVAYLGADQLRQFGADIYTVDLVAVAVLRELGVLLTAIIVAGRSGSAFAAEIGVMKLNDEVDALKSIGVNPFEVLVLPRLIGLVIAMPLLTIVADMMGLAGGAILTSLLLDMPFSQFLQRMQEILAPTTFWAGLVKAPVFAMLIAMVGTYRGMQVRDSSRELGRLTTVAVVQSIFLVILADAIFAVVFVEIDF
jgi:phospholipid/cholesterol/gamma-HCH transport system permease protein